MFPIGDTEGNRYSRFPVMMLIIVLINIAVFFYEGWVLFEHGVEGIITLFNRYGARSDLIYAQKGGPIIAAVTSTFLHGGPVHLGGNMLALWVFGRRVEDACGPWRFLFFYLTCGIAAGLASAAALFGDPIPSIGASGAVYGVMGAHLILYPEGRIRTLVFLVFGIPTTWKIRAFWVVLLFVVTQIIPALEVLYSEAQYSVGYWAHLGGFVFSVFILLFLRPEAYARYMSHADV